MIFDGASHLHGCCACFVPVRVGFGQVQLLQAELKPSYPSLEINTIDKYQGRDKEVIDVHRGNDSRLPQQREVM